MAAGFIKEVFHPEWLANPVLVKKKGGKWRMCVDYTGLNKACPKVPYPLPHIDQIVDSTAGCETLSFLDAYSGLLGPCFVAEGPTGRNTFGKTWLYVIPKLPLMKLRYYSISEGEGSNRLKDGMTF
jgi:hypothetical protein